MKIVALAGGVGGAKFVHGLAQVLEPNELTVVVNTGDDFEHYGLTICPDIDTVCYTLAGIANPETGWGRNNESWIAIENASKLGGPDWFRLGDQDLGTHLERTRRLNAGEPLSNIISDFCKAWGIQQKILPMSDQPVRTIVETEEGMLSFQEYFVHRKCEPQVKGFRYEGAPEAKPAPGVDEAIYSADAVIFCPSNPWVSIDPILSVVTTKEKSVYAISPIIQGQTIKGPAAKMYRELGIEPSALAVAMHFRSVLKGFVFDTLDRDMEASVRQLITHTRTFDTIMRSDLERKQLARNVLDFIGETL